MTATTLSARSLSVVFGMGRVARKAVDDVTIAFQRGCVTLLKGPSGSGKTTLLSVLGGLLRPHQGVVDLNGDSLYGEDDCRAADKRRRYIGFVFQDARLFPRLRAVENVRIPLDLRGISRPEADARARDLLGRMGLADRGGAMPRELSGGEQQRVALARALAADPSILLADEPTAALDSFNGLEVGKLLRRAAREFGKTVVIVTHDERLTAIADRIVELADGRIVADRG